jgi:hypothetical protein
VPRFKCGFFVAYPRRNTNTLFVAVAEDVRTNAAATRENILASALALLNTIGHQSLHFSQNEASAQSKSMLY